MRKLKYFSGLADEAMVGLGDGHGVLVFGFTCRNVCMQCVVI